MAADYAWSTNLRLHESSVTSAFHKAKSRHDVIHCAQRLSIEKDRNDNPHMLQHLYMSDKVHRTFEQLQEENRDKMDRLRQKFGEAAVIPQFNPFTAGVFNEDEDDGQDHNLIFKSSNYRYSQRLTNPLEKGKGRRLRALPCKAYVNHLLWSTKSIALEETLRQLPILNDLSMDKLMTTLDRMKSGQSVGMVDVLWATRSGDWKLFGLHPNTKDSLGRLSNFTESMLRFDSSLTKETFREVEFDALVLTLVNDFVNMQKQLRTNVILTKYTDLQPLRSTDREGDCKVEALLLAVTADNYLHTRPLCTSADLSLAMYELLDPKIFSTGIIHIPQLLPMQYTRHLEGFYRFNFRSPFIKSTWQYIKYNFPFNMRDLKPYLTGIYCSPTDDCKNNFAASSKLGKITTCNPYFVVTEIKANALPIHLVHFAQQFCVAFSNAWNQDEIVVAATIDIEACCRSADSKRDSDIVAPHLVSVSEVGKYVYRVRHVHSFQGQTRSAVGRRNAIAGLDGVSLRYLKDFHNYYHNERAVLSNVKARGEAADSSSMSSVQIAGMEYARQHHLEMLEESESDRDDCVHHVVDDKPTPHSEESIIVKSDRQVGEDLAISPAVESLVLASTIATVTAAESHVALKKGRTHRASVLMLDRHRKEMEQEMVYQSKETARLERKERAGSKAGILEQGHATEGIASRSTTADTDRFSARVASSRRNSRRPTVGGKFFRTNSSLRGLGSGEAEAVEETNSEGDTYRDVMNKALEEYLLACPTELKHQLCEKNIAAKYNESIRATRKLLQRRNRYDDANGLTTASDISSPPVPIGKMVLPPNTCVISEDQFFRDPTLEKKVEHIAQNTNLEDLFGGLDIADELRKALPETDENTDDRAGSEKLSSRSPRWYEENESDKLRAYNLLLDGIGGRVARRMRELDRLEKMKEYIKRRRCMEYLTMKQVSALHIIHHFDKPVNYSSSSDDEEPDDGPEMTNLLGDYADIDLVQSEVDARAAEERPRRASVFRPKSADFAPVSPELYRRLSMRVSVHRDSISEGSPRRDSKAVIRKGRNSFFISLNNVLLDGKIIQEVATLKDLGGVDEVHWLKMTDSESTVISQGDQHEHGGDEHDDVDVMPQVREADKEIDSPGGKLWGLNKGTVSERHFTFDFMEADTGTDTKETNMPLPMKDMESSSIVQFFNPDSEIVRFELGEEEGTTVLHGRNQSLSIELGLDTDVDIDNVLSPGRTLEGDEMQELSAVQVSSPTTTLLSRHSNRQTPLAQPQLLLSADSTAIAPESNFKFEELSSLLLELNTSAAGTVDPLLSSKACRDKPSVLPAIPASIKQKTPSARKPYINPVAITPTAQPRKRQKPAPIPEPNHVRTPTSVRLGILGQSYDAPLVQAGGGKQQRSQEFAGEVTKSHSSSALHGQSFPAFWGPAERKSFDTAAGILPAISPLRNTTSSSTTGPADLCVVNQRSQAFYGLEQSFLDGSMTMGCDGPEYKQGSLGADEAIEFNDTVPNTPLQGTPTSASLPQRTAFTFPDSILELSTASAHSSECPFKAMSEMSDPIVARVSEAPPVPHTPSLQIVRPSQSHGLLSPNRLNRKIVTPQGKRTLTIETAIVLPVAVCSSDEESKTPMPKPTRSLELSPKITSPLFSRAHSPSNRSKSQDSDDEKASAALRTTKTAEYGRFALSAIGGDEFKFK